MKDSLEIRISSRMAEQLQLPEYSSLILCAGQREVMAQWSKTASEKPDFVCSEALKQALSVKHTRNLQLRFDSVTGKLHLGAIVGILAFSLPTETSRYRPTGFLAELLFLAKISRDLPGCFFFFRPDGVQWEKKLVWGYQYTEEGIWQKDFFPLPDVIYDRIPSRRLEAGHSMRRMKQKIREMGGIHYFNSTYFNKWKLYCQLSQAEELRPYLPETCLLTEERLDKMLERYDTLFAKPANGSMGRGIIRITRSPKRLGGIRYTLYRHKIVHGYAASSADFLRVTRAFRRGWTYILQQGLDLLLWQESALDLRIILQKNGHGDWKLSKRFFRVAQRGSSIANLSSGGHVETYKDLLPRLLRRKTSALKKLNQEMLWLSQSIAVKLEESGCFGELGLDLGLGKDGRLWLIEVNSKPRKTTETEMSMKIVHNTFRRPLEYAIFLAGFSQRTMWKNEAKFGQN